MIKVELKKLDMVASRGRIGRLLKKNGWFPHIMWLKIIPIRLRVMNPI